jgi:hypothetical protein
MPYAAWGARLTPPGLPPSVPGHITAVALSPLIPKDSVDRRGFTASVVQFTKLYETNPPEVPNPTRRSHPA